MKSASGSELTFEKAKESDIKDIIELLYITKIIYQVRINRYELTRDKKVDK